VSNGGNHSGTFVDTELLRDHVSKLREEKKIALKLYENVRAMKALSDPANAYQYDSILRNVEQMLEYFDRMYKVLDNVEDDAVQLSHELTRMMEDDTYDTRHIVSKSIML